MYDAIVVGARCGGAPTAMLLARRGFRVLLVDRTRFPSDTVSTHFIWPPGTACLARWGLLERVLATGCPVVRSIGLDLGEFQLTGEPPAADGVALMCAPRRTVLDKLLLDAAAEAGAEVREEFNVTGLTASAGRVTGIEARARGGTKIAESARIVIGADGRHSLVARAAGAAEYNVRPALTCVLYAYWQGVAPHVPAIHPLPRRLFISFPTNDGTTVTPVIFPRDELPKIRADLDWHLVDTLGQVASLAEPFRGACRVERIRGTGDLPNFFRQPYGEGWALVGDAGYTKDPVLAQGISDAFRSAEWLTDAVHAGLSGARPTAEALADYRKLRGQALGPMYDLSCEMAALAPPSPAMEALFRRCARIRSSATAISAPSAAPSRFPSTTRPRTSSGSRTAPRQRSTRVCRQLSNPPAPLPLSSCPALGRASTRSRRRPELSLVGGRAEPGQDVGILTRSVN